MYCSKCKATDTKLVKISQYKLKDGTIKRQYYCNPCNTNRVNRYLKSDEGKIAFKKARENNMRKNPIRYESWKKANYAEYSGRLKKKPCAVCGDDKVHKHHPNPYKPLEVVHLCPLHHKEAHR